ncbi:hypothetical protein [Streptomyces swartbergensis]|uniref:DUF308 domain-containing protein n=1 Tax=Streptomyces swartbergensis TaxID=487165 RepID=A0A243S4D4_9ACTN|nr:hypothetical protein [Streptomyces swartbergensis]OUD02430.1 hypothetical protein CA983_14975 [Streptomyces swartbergensis]
MAEHDSDREGREPDEKGVPFDEEAAWAAIVAGYGDEPPDPPGAKPFKSIEDLALLESPTNDDRVDTAGASGNAAKPAEPEGPERSQRSAGSEASEASEAKGSGSASGDNPAKPLGGSVSFAPGVGPRDYSAPEPTEDDFDEDDEGHFVPPEPPPLPSADPTAKFAWLGVLGGPVLVLLAVLLGWEMTWWLTTLAIGGFLGGFATLVMRMRTDDEDDDDPGRGAVV